MRPWSIPAACLLSFLVVSIEPFGNPAHAQAPLAGCKGDACEVLQTQHTDHGIRVRNTSDRPLRVVLHTCPSGQEEFYLKPHSRLGTRFMEICGGYEVYYAEAKARGTP